MISVVILTKNEEKNIEECLKTLKWCDEVVVVDDNSEDKTVEIARKMGATVFSRALEGDFSAQRNFALRQAQGDWILFIDADEQVSPQLRAEIKSTINHQPSTINGYFLRREDKIWGTTLKHGETAGVRLIRLGRKGAGKWARPIHETWDIKGEIGELKSPLLHLPHQTISEFLEEINFYSTLRARELYNRFAKTPLSQSGDVGEARFQASPQVGGKAVESLAGKTPPFQGGEAYNENKKTNLFEILAYPKGKFLKNYFLKLGILDGMPGFIVALLMSFHSFLVRAKLYLLWKQEGRWR